MQDRQGKAWRKYSEFILSPVKNDGKTEKTNLYLNWCLFLIENYQLEESCSSEDSVKYNFFSVSYYIEVLLVFFIYLPGKSGITWLSLKTRQAQCVTLASRN